MLDNIAGLLMTVGLLAAVFDFPTTFALQYMVPGTAIGVLLGDLMFFAMALAMARRTGRSDVTAMPLGLDTPSTIAMVLFVLGPSYRHALEDLAYTETQAATYTWHIGICAIFISGVFKLACTFVSGAVRRLVPRAGLLGSLSAVALTMISFLPLLDILSAPLVGLVALAIVLTTLIARVPLPWRVPGALGALLVAGAIHYLVSLWTDLLKTGPVTVGVAFDPADGLLPVGWLDAFRWEWCDAFGASFQYLPIIIPFALATVVGGIDCTESAAAAGDEYDTRKVIGVEGVATLLAAMCGGVVQTTPYIGHPAYKAMGGRSAYTLATALFVGGAGLLGYFGYLYLVIPKAAIFPILIFIGLEITAQSFQATPVRHFAALAFACVPALAKLVITFVHQVLDQAQRTIDSLQGSLPDQLQTIQILASGFIVTSLLWGAALSAIIDRRLRVAGNYFAVAALCTLFGIIHSPFRDERLFLPWALGDALPQSAAGQTPLVMAAAYLLVAGMLWLWGALCRTDPCEGC